MNNVGDKNVIEREIIASMNMFCQSLYQRERCDRFSLAPGKGRVQTNFSRSKGFIKGTKLYKT